MLMSTSTRIPDTEYLNNQCDGHTHLCSLLVRSSADVRVIDGDDLVPAPEALARVSGRPGQDEGDEDALPILAPHYVEAQASSDRKSTRLNSSHSQQSRMPSSA